MNTLISSPDTGSFQTSGSCPVGFVEHRIKYKNWYGEIEDSGWKWCTPQGVKSVSEKRRESSDEERGESSDEEKKVRVRRLR